MGINGQTKAYLAAVIMLLAAALQADSFLAPMAVGGRTASVSQVSNARGVVKMELSPYEEYMKSRGQSVAEPAPAPAPSPSPSSSSSPSPRSSGSKWSPAKPDWKSSKSGSSSPSPSSYSPPSPSPAPESPRASEKKSGEKHIGTGGMADTRDPDPINHEDPRKSISAAPSFEEYLKSKRN